MAVYSIKKVLALPAEASTNTVYYVKGEADSRVKLYVSDTAGTVYPVGILDGTDVLSTLLSGYSVGSDIAISSADSILQAFQKVQGQLNALSTSVSQGMKVPLPLDCSTEPNYPVAEAGDSYKVTVAGKIGGASGIIVQVGDLITASTDNGGGTQAAVGSQWFILQANTDNATESVTGLTRIATSGEVATGSEAFAYVTPLRLKGRLDLKQDTITGGATTITTTDLTANRALISSGSGKVAVSAVTNTELGYVSGATSNLQTQLNALVTAGSGYVPTARTLTINGTTQNLTANRTWNVGTVTSVALTVPTGLSIAGSPITTSGTFAITLQAGYAIPTTAKQTDWDTAYTNRISSLTVSGSSGAATLVSNVLNIPTYTLSGLGGVPTSRTLTINGTAFDLSADRTWTIPTHDAVTLGTANGLTLSTQVLSLGLASTSTTGALSSTDWNTFNNKQVAGNYVTLDTVQTITAIKTFDNPIIFNYNIPSADGTAGSGNSILAGISYDNVESPGTNYPLSSGTLLNVKFSSARHFQLFAGSNTNQFYMRTVHTSTTIPWAKLWTDVDLVNPITGTGVAGQIAYWNGTNNQTGDAGFTWNNGELSIKNPTTIAYNSTRQTIPSSSITLLNLQGAAYKEGTTEYISSRIAFVTDEVWNGTSGGSSIRFYTTTNGTLLNPEKWRIRNDGVFQSSGSQTIQTSTGDLTLATAAGNGNINLTPHGTGGIVVKNRAKLTFNTGYIYDYESERTDITALTGGSTNGMFFKSKSNSHLVMGIDGNDNSDSFAIVSHSATTATTDDKAMDTLVFQAFRDGKIIMPNISTSGTGGNYIVDLGGTDGLKKRTAAQVLTDVGAVTTARTVTAGTGLTGGGALSANITLALTGQALALHNLATNGFIVRTGSGTVAARSVTSTGLTVTNGNGVSGNINIEMEWNELGW